MNKVCGRARKNERVRGRGGGGGGRVERKVKKLQEMEERNEAVRNFNCLSWRAAAYKNKQQINTLRGAVGTPVSP